MTSEDLLDHFKLEAKVTPTYTVHLSHRLNRARGLREQVETKWHRMDRVGKGAFGEVWQEVKYRADGTQEFRAVKVLEKSDMKRYCVDVRKELLALAVLSKEKYFEEGDLSRHINDISDEDEVRQIACNLLEGLNIIHGEGFAHRDLKPQNIFVSAKPPRSQRWCVKIGDFGISKRVKSEDTAWRTETGTPHFMAPEIQGFIHSCEETSVYTNAVDVWSLGCVIYYCSTGAVPFNTSRDCNRYCCGRSELPVQLLSRRLGVAGVKFIKRLLMPEPAHRRTIAEGLKDPWIIGLPATATPGKPIAAFGTESRSRVVSMEQVCAGPSSKYDFSTFRSERTYADENLTSFPSNVVDRTFQCTAPSSQWSTVIPNKPVYASLSSTREEPSHTTAHGEQSDNVTEKIQAKVIASSSQLQLIYPASGIQAGGQASDMTAYQPSSNAVGEQQLLISSGNLPFRSNPGGKLGDLDQGNNHHSRNDHEQNNPLILRTPHSRPTEQGAVSTADAVGSEYLSIVPVTAHRRGSGIDWERSIKLKAHSHWIVAVTFSPDGEHLVSGSGDKTIRLWNTKTWECQKRLTGHSYSVNSLSFSPDGELLASGSADGTIRLWNTKTWECQKTLTGHKRLSGVSFSPGGEHLASGSCDKTIRIWSTKTWDCQKTLTGHSSYVYSISFSPDGERLASGSADYTIRLWNTKTWECQKTLTGHSSYVHCVSFSPNGEHFASGCEDATIKLWNTKTWECQKTLTSHLDWVLSVSFSPNGELLASGSYDMTIQLWNTKTWECQKRLTGHSYGVHSLSFSPDGELLASGSSDKTIRLWGDVPEQLREPVTKREKSVAKPSLRSSIWKFFS